MKILVDASLIKYAKVFSYAKFNVGVYHTDTYSAFDVFDTFQPDIYIGNVANIPNTLVKTIKERPALKLSFLHENTIHTNLKALQDEGIMPSYVMSRNPAEFPKDFKVYRWEYTADLLTYMRGSLKPEFSAHVSVVENSIHFDLPELNENVTYRIFSPQLINHINYCGNVNIDNIKHIYASSKVSLCSEENGWNCVVAGGLPLSLHSTSEEIYKSLKTDSTKLKQSLLKEALGSLTSFHTCATMLKYFNLNQEATKIEQSLEDFIK